MAAASCRFGRKIFIIHQHWTGHWFLVCLERTTVTNFSIHILDPTHEHRTTDQRGLAILTYYDRLNKYGMERYRRQIQYTLENSSEDVSRSIVGSGKATELNNALVGIRAAWKTTCRKRNRHLLELVSPARYPSQERPYPFPLDYSAPPHLSFNSQ